MVGRKLLACGTLDDGLPYALAEFRVFDAGFFARGTSRRLRYDRRLKRPTMTVGRWGFYIQHGSNERRSLPDAEQPRHASGCSYLPADQFVRGATLDRARNVIRRAA